MPIFITRPIDILKYFIKRVTFTSFNRYVHKMEKFGSFYQDHNKMLFSYLMRMTGDYYLASDIMQESFTRYFERYAKQTSNVSLLFTIARNALLDQLRVRERNSRLEKDLIDGSRSQEYDLMVKQEYRQDIKAMQELKENERDILALAISDGLVYRDIALSSASVLKM